MRRRIKIICALVVTLLGALVALPWLIPTGAWITRIEGEASARLGARVRVADLHLSLLPLPRAVVSGLDVGDGAMAARSVAVYPRVLSVFDATPALRSVEVEQLVLGSRGMALLEAAAAKPRGGDTMIRIERVRAREVRVEMAAGSLPAFDAELALDLDAAMPVNEARIATRDGKARLLLAPDAGAWKLTLDASDWQLPLGPPLRFARLQAVGRLTSNKLDVPTISAVLYGGSAAGRAELAWPGDKQKSGWRLAGELKVSAIDLTPLTESLKVKSALTGRLDASGPFRAHSTKAAGLADAFNADVAFEVRDGVLHGFDLASAAQSLLKGGAGGGHTRFDQLAGAVKVQGRALKLQNVRVTSGVLKALGNVDISPAKKLAGRVDTEVKGTAGLVGVPLAVSGTLDAPVLLPTRGSVAGAVVGSMLLPGVGTTIGSGVGDKIGQMFGK